MTAFIQALPTAGSNPDGESSLHTGGSALDAVGSFEALVPDIVNLLDSFDGEESFKTLFWQILSYDRVREPLRLSFLPPSAVELVTAFEVFATSDAMAVVYIATTDCPDGYRIEQMTAAVKRHVGNCVVLLHYFDIWSLVYPDDTIHRGVRFLPMPGPVDRRTDTARALAALSAVDVTSGEELETLELAENVDTFFPGATPNITDILDDFSRIALHPNPEIRELLSFIREASKFPLLTPAQERGEDIVGNQPAPDGTAMSYYHWRLVLHNLRLVPWVARRVPRMGLELADLVQEGVIGLIIAAQRYNPDLGFRFTTYAFYWVRQRMLRALHNGCNLIRWPVWTARELISAAVSGDGKGLSPGEKPVILVPWDIRLNTLLEADPMEFVDIDERRFAVRNVITNLRRKEQIVIAKRFGIGCDHQHTLEEIGDELGLTRERIRQIEAKALKKLKGQVGLELRAHHQSLEKRLASDSDFVRALSHPPFYDLVHELQDSRSLPNDADASS